MNKMQHAYIWKRGKLKEKWLGPYTINRSIEKGVYELRNTKGKVCRQFSTFPLNTLTSSIPRRTISPSDSY